MSDARVIHKIAARTRDLDGAMTVRRALPAPRHRSVGPFVFLDQIGPVPFAPGQGMDVRPHPHIGLATVTYLYEGAITHRDSLGYDQVIRPGDVNWMTAGRGIVHSERSEPEHRRSGGTLFGIQAWVALPPEQEDAEPRFEHHPKSTLPALEEDGVRIRVIAGSFAGQRSPVRFPGELTYIDVRSDADRTVEVPRSAGELAVYIASGALEIGGQRCVMGDLCLLSNDGSFSGRVLAPSRFLVLGGPPLEVPRHMYWNFVSTRAERIDAAKEDWRQGRFDQVPGETDRVPLPGDVGEDHRRHVR